MVDLEFLRKRIEQTAANFKFKQDENFAPFAKIILKYVQDIQVEELDRKFYNIWLISSEEWNKRYGYGGYPCLSDWLYLLTGKRPLTDEQRLLAKKEYDDRINYFTSLIGVWLKDPNLKISFPAKYKNPDNKFLRQVIDDFLNIKEELSDDKLTDLAMYLKDIYLKDKKLFCENIKMQLKKVIKLLDIK